MLHLNCIERYEDMIDRHSYRTLYTTVKLKIEKKYSGLNGTQTRDLCDITDMIFHTFTCNRIYILSLSFFSTTSTDLFRPYVLTCLVHGTHMG